MNFRGHLRPEVLLCMLAVVLQCLLYGASETLNKENCRISVPDENNIGQALYSVCSQRQEQDWSGTPAAKQILTGENSKAASVNRYRFIEKYSTYFIQLRRGLQNSAQTACKSNSTIICFRKVGTDILITAFLSNNGLMQLKPYGFQWRIFSKHSHGGRKQLKVVIYFFCEEFKKSDVFELPGKPQRNLSLWFKGLCPCENAQENSVDVKDLSELPSGDKLEVILIIVGVMFFFFILLCIVNKSIERGEHCCLRHISRPSSNQSSESPLLPNQSSECATSLNQSTEATSLLSSSDSYHTANSSFDNNDEMTQPEA